MQLELTTDRNGEGIDQLIAEIERAVDDPLARESNRLTHVKVHLGDENAGERGADDRRCRAEARPCQAEPSRRQEPRSDARGGEPRALQKLGKALETRFGRLDGHKGGATIRLGDER